MADYSNGTGLRTLAHTGLSDMPSSTNSDHDGRYYTESEIHDLISGANFDFFLNDTASGVGAYLTMTADETGDAESTFSDTITGDAFLIDSFITTSGEPTFTTLASGVYGFHFHAESTVGANVGTVRIYYELYQRTSGGAETLLVTSEESDVLTNAKTSYEIHGTSSDDIDLLATDRLVLKVYANIDTSRPSDPVATIYMEGTNATRLEVKSTIAAFDERYVRLDPDASQAINAANTDLNFTIHGTSNNVFFMDAGENRVGIGTPAPAKTLDVAGDIILTGTNPNYIYGGDTAGDDLVIRANDVDALPYVTLYGNHTIEFNTGYHFLLTLPAANDSRWFSLVNSTPATVWKTTGAGNMELIGDLFLTGANKELRFYEGANYIGFEAPALGANQIWVLPNADGNASDFLQTDGGGNLTWTAVGVGDVTAGANITDHAIVRGDGGAKGVQDSGVILNDTDDFTISGDTYFTINEGDFHIKPETAAKHVKIWSSTHDVNLRIGNTGFSQALDLYHDGTDAYIAPTTGDINLIPTDVVNVWGASHTAKLRLGSSGFSQALDMWHDGTDAHLDTTTGLIKLDDSTYVTGNLQVTSPTITLTLAHDYVYSTHATTPTIAPTHVLTLTGAGTTNWHLYDKNQVFGGAAIPTNIWLYYGVTAGAFNWSLDYVDVTNGAVTNVNAGAAVGAGVALDMLAGAGALPLTTNLKLVATITTVNAPDVITVTGFKEIWANG